MKNGPIVKKNVYYVTELAGNKRISPLFTNKDKAHQWFRHMFPEYVSTCTGVYYYGSSHYAEWRVESEKVQ